jgi:hypothetical protein
MACWVHLQAQQQRRSWLLQLQHMHTMATTRSPVPPPQQQWELVLLAPLLKGGCRRCRMRMVAGVTLVTTGHTVLDQQQRQQVQQAAGCARAALQLVVLLVTATLCRHHRRGRVATGLTVTHSSTCSRHVLQALKGCMLVYIHLVRTTALLLSTSHHWRRQQQQLQQPGCLQSRAQHL